MNEHDRDLPGIVGLDEDQVCRIGKEIDSEEPLQGGEKRIAQPECGCNGSVEIARHGAHHPPKQDGLLHLGMEKADGGVAAASAGLHFGNNGYRESVSLTGGKRFFLPGRMADPYHRNSLTLTSLTLTSLTLTSLTLTCPHLPEIEIETR